MSRDHDLHFAIRLTKKNWDGSATSAFGGVFRWTRAGGERPHSPSTTLATVGERMRIRFEDILRDSPGIAYVRVIEMLSFPKVRATTTYTFTLRIWL